MNEQSIFLAALEIADPSQRAEYLDRTCGGDAALRQQVEALLAAHARSGEFLDVPALQQMAAGGSPEATSAHDFRGEIDLSFVQPTTKPGSLGRLGHYEIEQVIGRGGCGIVLKAFDEKLQRVVAIKVMAPELAATSPARKRFLREARTAAAVRHENVISIHAVEDQPIPFLVMEYIDGQTLQDKLNETGPLDVREVVEIGRQIASGLAAAHAQGLIHRDIKPANILLEKGKEHIKITDFGLARSADDASVTQSGVIAGTPLYMSPEQAHGQALDQRSDLFSLGSVLYVMCSGRPPFRATTTLAVLKRLTEEEPRPIQEIISEVPDWLVKIIARLHAKKPDERFISAEEVAELLSRCLSELQTGGRVESIEPWMSSIQKPASSKQHPVEKKAPAAGAERPSPLGLRGRWVAAAAVLLLAGLSVTEGTGVTDLHGTVIRLFSPDGNGTLVVEVDDPNVSVTIDGQELVITGTGAREIRLKPGQYTLRASKDGKVVRQELVTVTRKGRQVVRVSREAGDRRGSDATSDMTRDADRRAAEWVLSIGGSLRGKPYPGRLFKAGDTIPEGNWKLTTANVVGNPRATDAGLAVFANCRNLSALYLSDTPVTNAGLVYFKDCKDLLTLELAHTAVTDKGLAVFKEHKRLEQLNLIGTRVTDKGLGLLGERPNLFRLLLGETAVGDTGLAVFKDCKKLATLDLRQTRVTEAGLAPFRDCRNLMYVHLDGMSIGDSAAALFKDCKNLTNFMLGGTKVGDEALDDIAKMRSLRLVGLKQTKVTAAGVQKLKAARPDLRIEWDGGVIDGATPEAGREPVNQNADAGQKTETVRQELRRRNPEFKGVIAYDVQQGHIVGCKIANGTLPDLAPLSALKELKQLDYAALDPRRDAPVLRDMKSLETINGHSAATFRLAYPANKPAGGVDAAWLKRVADLPVATRTEVVVKKLKELNPNADIRATYRAQSRPELKRRIFHGIKPGRLTTYVEEEQVVSLSIEGGDLLTDLSPLKAFPHLRDLSIRSKAGKSWLTDLSPLKGLQLKELVLHCVQVKDLTPLKGMRLESLELLYMPVADLTPLAGMPLKYLSIGTAPVSDLTPLKGMPLTELHFPKTRVSDIGPLKDSPLKNLVCSQTLVKDLAPLKGKTLTALACSLTPVSDLSPLKDMPLTSFNCTMTQVTDLTPLAGMPLEFLGCGHNGRLSDLSPLKGMPLKELWCEVTSVKDLSPLKGMPLNRLFINGTRVSELSPLKGMPLTVLNCSGSPVSDLSPLEGMHLNSLNCHSTRVSDLAPLKGMPLESVWVPEVPAENLEILRGIKSLGKINNMPAAEFWKQPKPAKPAQQENSRTDDGGPSGG